MRVWSNLILALTVAAVAAGPSRAQGPGGRGGFGFGPGQLLQNKSVQKELKLTEEDIAKVKKVGDELREKYKDDFAGLQGLQGDELREKRQEVMKRFNEDAQKAYNEILSDAQQKRLKQIGIQARGAMAFADPEVQKKLNITDEQKAKLMEIGQEARESFQEVGQLFRDGKQEEAQKKMRELNKAMIEKVVGLLNDEQKASWKEMTGEPFELKMEFPARRPRQNNQN